MICVNHFLFKLEFLEKNVPTITAFDKDGLKIIFSLEKMPETNSLSINVTATNNTLTNITDFLFQAAVPKVSSNYASHNFLELKISFCKVFTVTKIS